MLQRRHDNGYLHRLYGRIYKKKNTHKKACKNPNDQEYNQSKYTFIREHGDFENWDMIEIEKYIATDRHDLLKRERCFIELLKPSLNSNIPTQTRKEYHQSDHGKRITQNIMQRR